MLSTLQTQLAEHLPNQRHFLIGLSGGVDSVVLLDLFRRLPNVHLRAVHIHHGLSPNADSWAVFCEQLCQQYHVPFFCQRVQVSGDNGLEANARHTRYHAISEIIQPHEVLVTAHHLDDQAETFFLALKRGSGIQGLGAMQAVGNWQNFTIFRPLLSLPKTSLLDYATLNNLTWIVDESNESDVYDRNFLRHHILPILNQRWEKFSQMVARSAQHCAEQQALIEELLAEELEKRIVAEQGFSIQAFEQMHRLKQRQLLRLWLAKCGVAMPSQSQLQAVIDEVIFANADKNPQLRLGEKMVRRYQQTLYLTDLELPTIRDFSLILTPEDCGKVFRLPENIGTIVRADNELICTFSEKTDRLRLSSSLQQQPLTIQFYYSGKVRLYGKTQREEMKKIWQANGVPVWQRGRTPLLFYGEELVAVIGSKVAENMAC